MINKNIIILYGNEVSLDRKIPFKGFLENEAYELFTKLGKEKGVKVFFNSLFKIFKRLC